LTKKEKMHKKLLVRLKGCPMIKKQKTQEKLTTV